MRRVSCKTNIQFNQAVPGIITFYEKKLDLVWVYIKTKLYWMLSFVGKNKEYAGKYYGSYWLLRESDYDGKIRCLREKI